MSMLKPSKEYEASDVETASPSTVAAEQTKPDEDWFVLKKLKKQLIRYKRETVMFVFEKNALFKRKTSKNLLYI